MEGGLVLVLLANSDGGEAGLPRQATGVGGEAQGGLAGALDGAAQ